MILCPSLLNIDQSEYDETIKYLFGREIKNIHIDIMDRKFVKESGLDINIITRVKELSNNIFIDAHLMVKEPKIFYIDKCLELGADCIIIHYEILNKKNNLQSYIEYIKSKNINVKIGIAVNPKTRIEKVIKEIEGKQIDKVLLMSVEPGKGGQFFNEKVLKSIKKVWDYKIERGLLDLIIQVDGGITVNIAKTLKILGVNEIVVGTSLFNGDIEDNIKMFTKV